MKFQTGSVFGNRYTLGERIAVGGMGEVWRAEDRVLGRTVAMKLLSPSLADQPGFTRRFREEARNTAMLSHPNIAAVYDYGEDAGASWLVMELVEGEPLSQLIKDDGHLPSRRVSSILAQAALALQAAHDAGVIHRDVKPANILIRNDGQVKLTDFGIARAVDSAPITRTGEVMGTAQYISPEQATGKPAGPGSDLYSLGVVGHEMLTGKRPFDEGSPVATAMAHIHNPPPPLPEGVDPILAGVIFACLAKDPAARPESASAVASALRGGPEAASFASTQAMPPPPGATQRMGAAPTMAQPPAPMTQPGYAQPGYPQQYGHTGYQQQYPGYPPTGPLPEQQKRRSNAWPWILVAVLLLALGGVVLAQSGLFGGAGSAPTTAPTTSAPTTTTPTTSAPTRVRLDVASYRGLTQADATSRLQALGFDTVDTAQEASETIPAGRVVTVTPNGDVEVGTTLTLTISTGPQQTSTPSPSTPTSSRPTGSPSSDAGSGDNGDTGGSGGSGGNDDNGGDSGSDSTPGDGSTQGAGADAGAGDNGSEQARGSDEDSQESGGVAGAHVQPGDNGSNPSQAQPNSADQTAGAGGGPQRVWIEGTVTQ